MKRWITLTLSGLFCCGVLGAMDGELAPESTGSFDITLDVAPIVKVSGMENIDLVFDTRNPVSNHAFLCVYSNTPARSYQVRVTTDSGDFSLTNGDGRHKIPFTVSWSSYSPTQDRSQQHTIELLPNVDAHLYSDEVQMTGSKDEYCSAGKNAELTITPKNDGVAAAGKYKATIYLSADPL